MLPADYDALMDELKKREELRLQPDGAYEAWLRGASEKDMCTHLYSRSHGRLRICVWPRNTAPEAPRPSSCSATLSITTIDDACAVMHGPTEPWEKAQRRVERLLEWVKAWNGQVPSRVDFELVAHQCGMAPDYN